MARSPEQLVAGILGCIPNEEGVKQTLRGRLNAIIEMRLVPNHKFAAPEVFQEANARKTQLICEACEEVLGDPSACAWKQKVVSYLSGR